MAERQEADPIYLKLAGWAEMSAGEGCHTPEQVAGRQEADPIYLKLAGVTYVLKCLPC